MNVRDLIPWGRQERGLSLYQPEESGPFASFHREVNRLFDEALRGFDMPRTSPMAMTSNAWPRLETSENDNEIRIIAELPGMDEKDIDLSIDNGMLTLKGEKKSEVEDRERGYSERFYGRFERRLSLPQGVMEDKCDASFRNGVLTIHLPKSAEAKERTRRIPISGEDTTKH